MTGTLGNTYGNTQTGWPAACDVPLKGAADVSKSAGLLEDAEDEYPVEIMPVGDPRPSCR